MATLTNASLSFREKYTQADFEGCANILTCDRTPQEVTIEPIMPCTNVDFFREKGAKKFGSH
jgi:hypothetical protein